MTRPVRVYTLLQVVFLLAGSTLRAQTVPTGFTWANVATGLSSPTAMTISPDGRLFVCQKGGAVRVIKNNTLVVKPFLSITVDQNGERGLLGIACDPDFVTNQYVYVYHTVPSPLHNRITRYTASGDTALGGTAAIILDLDNLGASNHNGGAIHFGPDGKLYAAVGENAVGSNSQSFSNLLGKMLRINSSGTIPIDNPFILSTTGRNQAIWAMGLRNPFTFAFQPGTSRMFINDVGNSSWEEINDGVAGANYGWPTDEGIVPMTSFKNPMVAYSSSVNPECAITGGAFYNPSLEQFGSSYVGNYFFSDYCAGWIHLFHPADSSVTLFGSGFGAPVDLQVSSDGTLYVVDINGGRVVRVQFPEGLPVQLSSFSGSILGNGTVLLQWTTLSELNNYGFYVQSRAGNQGPFSDVAGGFVPGHYTTNVPWQYSFLDTAAGHGTWTYRLKQVELDGSAQYTEGLKPQNVNGVGGRREIPASFGLDQNYPNPFNPATTIRYELAAAERVRIDVSDLLGREVAVLMDGEQPAGRYEVTWDAKGMASGVYYCRMEAGSFRSTKAMLLMK